MPNGIPFTLRRKWDSPPADDRQARVPGQSPPRRPSAGRSPLQPLHGQVLPLLRAADRQAEDLGRFRLHPLVLAARRASIFTEEGCWYLLVHNRCKHLRDDQLCDIYETRPQICRDYTTDDCEYDDEWVYDHYWETPEQIEEYAEAVLGPREGESIRSAKPQAAAVRASLIPNP